MPKNKKSDKKPIEQYEHKRKDRLNNPPVGLVTPETDKESGKQKYAYDLHLDPQLHWAGKSEHTSFEVPTVSLHVHEELILAQSSRQCGRETATAALSNNRVLHLQRKTRHFVRP